MTVSSAWSLCHQLGSTLNTWNTSTLVILDFSDATSFIGEISDDDTSLGIFRARVSGTLRGRQIRWRQAARVYRGIDENTRWQLATLDFMGTLADDGRRIQSGRIRSAPQFHAGDVLCGTFKALRVPLPLSQVNHTFPVGCLAVVHYTRTSVVRGDAMLDALDLHGASIEVLQSWRAREASVLRSLPRARSRLMPSIRDILLRQMDLVLHAAGISEMWCSAISLLDTYSYSFHSDTFIEDLPLACAAILRLVQSLDSTKAHILQADFVDYASSTSQWLYNAGHVTKVQRSITCQLLRDREKAIILQLRGLACLPTAVEWLSVFFTRLQVLTHDQYAMSLASAGSRCELLAKMCVLVLDTCDPIFPPSSVANGLLVHSLVAVRLLPVELLQPPCIDFQQWEMVFATSQPEGRGAALPCMLALNCVAVLVQQVQASAGMDLAILREDSYHMATFMLGDFQALRTQGFPYQR